MAYIQANPKKWIEESYIPDWVEKIQPKPFEPKLIPWINEEQINTSISIET